MIKEQALTHSKNLNIDKGVLSLWVFKRKSNGDYTAKSINVTTILSKELKKIITNTLQTRSEIENYSLLAQNNEASCLHVGTDETSFPELKALVDRPAEEHHAKNKRDYLGIIGYLVRLRIGSHTLYCVRRVTDAWKTAKAKNIINVVLNANQLELVTEKNLTIAKNFDFFVLNNDVLIHNKRAFESLLNYRIQYTTSFATLQSDAIFSNCFACLEPLIEYVGTNAMHLRRMAVVHQKANYANPAYMERLRQINEEEYWNIAFSEDGQIIATPDTVRIIIQVLLNHRLHSKLSLTTFDVPSSTSV